MFCGLLDLPIENSPTFLKWAKDLIYTPQAIFQSEGEEAAKAFRLKVNQEMKDFVESLIRERKANPGDDVVTELINSEVHGRSVTDEEVVNMVTLLFFAGTDSTAGSISYAHIFLAQNPDYKNQIINHLDDADYIWTAAEELIRFHGFHHMSREVAKDCEFGGVQLKKGETIVLPTQSANRDDQKFENALTVDLERKNANQHLTFGAGVHRCLGSHLATSQVRIALQEIHTAIPDYQLSGPVVYGSGGPKLTPVDVPMTFSDVA